MSLKMKEYSALLDQLLVLDKEREALSTFIDVLRVEIQIYQNRLTEEKDQISALKVSDFITFKTNPFGKKILFFRRRKIKPKD